METATENPKPTSTAEMTRLYRFLEITDLKLVRAAEGDEPATYDIVISTETEVQRWFGKETLGHGEGEIDLGLARKGLALILDHYGEQVGVVENIRQDVAEKKLRGEMRFSRSVRGREIEQDVKDKIRKYISVGYDPVSAKVTEASENLRDRKVRLIRWKPLETSIVKIPADPKAGVGRDGAGPETFPVTIEGVEPAREVRSMSAGAPQVTEPAKPAAAVAVVEDHSKRASEIGKLADAYDQDGKLGLHRRIPGWLEKNLTREEVLEDILGTKVTARGALVPTIQPGSEQVVAAPENDRRRYSYRKVVLAAASIGDRNFKFDGVEAEYDQELRKRTLEGGMQIRSNAILAPVSLYSDEELFERRMAMEDRETRTLDTKTVTKGAELVQDQQPRQFLELLRNKSVFPRMGGQFITGLVGGDIPWVKQTGAATGMWIGENPPAGVTAADMTFGLVYLKPKTRMAKTGWSRQLLAQSSFSIENKVRNDFAKDHALAFDRAGLHGKGGTEPLGIYNWPGVQTQTFAAIPDYAKLVDMQGKIGDKNADDEEMGYIMTSLLASKLKQTPEHATLAAAGWIWRGRLNNGEVAGYRAMTSQQLSKTMTAAGDADTGGAAHGLIHGNFGVFVTGMWGALEILVDPYEQKDKALVVCNSYQLGDDLIEYPEAFCIGIDARLA